MNPSNHYHFITRWRMESTCQEISDILGNAVDLARWWPSVYMEVKVLQKGDANFIGQKIGLYTKGWLPYTLRWAFTTIENNSPYGFVISPEGDFEGRGVWTFTQDGNFVDIVYDWEIVGKKWLFKYFSFLMKPIFKFNHEWAMIKGEESLRLELQRRRGENVPPPPGPTFPHNLSWM